MRIAVPTTVAALAVLFGTFATPALAWLRVPYEDEQVVRRSDLIAVAHIKPKSIEYVQHAPDHPGAGRSWEHHAVLVLDEVLKGDPAAKEIPIVVHYGLDPVEGGRLQRDGVSVRGLPGPQTKPADMIEIMDTGNSGVSFTPLVPDASKPNLWFLRKLGGKRGGEPTTPKTPYGIVDPEDVQPLPLKAYFACYFAEDPEAAVRAQLQRQPDISVRATRYLAHREVERILKLPDAAARVERLMPYWLSDQSWGLSQEAEQGILAAGEVAGPYLKSVFETRPQRRDQVIRMWGKLKYRESVRTLIALLESHDKFWASQTLEQNWWNGDPDNARRSRRREVYGETYAAVRALHNIGDRTSADILRKTHARWSSFNFDNPQMVEECADALRDWGVATTQPAR